MKVNIALFSAIVIGMAVGVGVFTQIVILKAIMFGAAATLFSFGVIVKK